MTQPDTYLLGRSEAEEARLRQQIVDLAPDSEAHLEGPRPRASQYDVKPLASFIP